MSDEKYETNANIWTDSIEKVLKNMGESCEGYKWMNIFAARKSSFRYNLLMYSLLFFGPVSGILSTLISPDNKQQLKTIQIFITIFSFVSGVISAIIKFSKFEQKSSSHKNIASRYASLESNIRRQLSLHRKERVNAGNYLEWSSKLFDELFSTTPLLSDDIYDKWVIFAKENGLIIPEKFGQTIEIIDTPESEDITVININNGDENIKQEGINTIKRKRAEAHNSIINFDLSTDAAMQYELRRLKDV